jgi:hypothetical protein
MTQPIFQIGSKSVLFWVDLVEDSANSASDVAADADG